LWFHSGMAILHSGERVCYPLSLSWQARLFF
jgi:hypothetical protein